MRARWRLNIHITTRIPTPTRTLLLLLVRPPAFCAAAPIDRSIAHDEQAAKLYHLAPSDHHLMHRPHRRRRRLVIFQHLNPLPVRVVVCNCCEPNVRIVSRQRSRRPGHSGKEGRKARRVLPAWPLWGLCCSATGCSVCVADGAKSSSQAHDGGFTAGGSKHAIDAACGRVGALRSKLAAAHAAAANCRHPCWAPMQAKRSKRGELSRIPHTTNNHQSAAFALRRDNQSRPPTVKGERHPARPDRLTQKKCDGSTPRPQTRSSSLQLAQPAGSEGRTRQPWAAGGG